MLELCEQLSGAGYHAWLVGGSVRDSLLAQLNGSSAPGSWGGKDWDLATDATPTQVMQVFRRVIPTGIEHGTVTVLIGKRQFELTTLRTEFGYSDGRRPEQVGFVTSIDEDLARRDFTVNAIAFDPVTQQLIDPFEGLSDLALRRLRAVGDPSGRFAEDGLRVLRAARFVAALEFELDEATARAIRPSLGTYRQVSAERIRDEWNKTLRARAPSRGFRIMQEHGLLEITAPELAAQDTGSEDGGNAFSLALRRVDLCPAQLELRLAALLSGLDASPSRSAELADALLGRLRYANAERKTIGRLIRAQALPLDPEPSDAGVRHWLRNVGPDLYRELCVLTRAGLDAAGDSAASQALGASLERLERRASEQLAQKAALSLSELAIDGKQLMRELDLRPGPHVGKMLAALLDRVLEEPALNTRERLIELARAWRP